MSSLSNKQENLRIRKSLENMKHYLENSNYTLVIDFDSLDYNEICQSAVGFEVTSMIPSNPTIYLYYTYNNLNKSKLDSFLSSHLYFDKDNSDTNIIKKQDTLLIITKDYSVDSTQELLRNKYNNYYVNIYKVQQLQYNILKHNYVPKHIKLNEDEKHELFKKYNIKNDSQLPQIGRYDAVASVIFLRPGEVCKIIRYDKISFENEYYRICVG